MQEKYLAGSTLHVSSVPLAAVAGIAVSALAAGQTSVYAADATLLSTVNAGNASDSMKSKFVVSGRPLTAASGKNRVSLPYPARAVKRLLKRAGVAGTPFSKTYTLAQSATTLSYNKGYLLYKAIVQHNATNVISPIQGNELVLTLGNFANPLTNDQLAKLTRDAINQAGTSVSQVLSATSAVADTLVVTAIVQQPSNILHVDTQLQFSVRIEVDLVSDSFLRIDREEVVMTETASAGAASYNTYSQVFNAERAELLKIGVSGHSQVVDESLLLGSANASVPLYDDLILILEPTESLETPVTITLKVPAGETNTETYLETYFALYGIAPFEAIV